MNTDDRTPGSMVFWVRTAKGLALVRILSARFPHITFEYAFRAD